MAQRLETDIVLNLAGNLAAKARQYGASMSEFANKNQKAMMLVQTTARAAGRGIDALGNRYVGLATTVATGATVRNIGNFEEQMTRLGTNAKLTSDQVDALSKSILDVANQKDVRVNFSELAAGVDELLGKTGDFEFVQENLQNMGLFMQAFGVDAKTTGGIFSQFREKGIRDSQAVMDTIDQLYGQFAIGSVNVKDLASISEQLFSTYQGQGPEAIAQMSALVQLFAKAKGNANESLTSIQAVFATFSDKKKVEFLDSKGIKVFKEGTQQLKEPVDLLMQILETANNNPLALGDVFDNTAIQGLASLYTEDRKNLLKQMVSGTVELGATQKASAKNAETLNSAMRSLNNSFFKLANDRLADPIMDIADAINSVDDEAIERWAEWGETALYVVGGLVAAKKGLDIAASIKTVFGKSGPMPGGKGGFQDLGAMPVYVVNMPGGGLAGDGSMIDGPSGSNKKGGGLKSAVITVAQASIVAAGINAAYDLTAQAVTNKVRRKEDVDLGQAGRLGLEFSEETKNAVVVPGLLDVFDEIKAWMSGGNNQTSDFSPSMRNQSGEMRLKVEVSDDRTKVTPTYLPPGFTIDPDMGVN